MLFSSARSPDFDGMFSIELPVSMYTTKTPIDLCRFTSSVNVHNKNSNRFVPLYFRCQCTQQKFQSICAALLLVSMYTTKTPINLCRFTSGVNVHTTKTLIILCRFNGVIDSQVTSFQHTDVLLILRLPHSSILMCYWFSGYLISAYWCVNDSQVTSF